MKITNVTATVAKVMTAGFLAGALLMAAPAKAEAQQFTVGLQVGYPHYGYFQDDYYRREAFRRHEEWVRAHEYRCYHHDAPYWYR